MGKYGDRPQDSGELFATRSAVLSMLHLSPTIAIDVPHHVTQRANARHIGLESDIDSLLRVIPLILAGYLADSSFGYAVPACCFLPVRQQRHWPFAKETHGGERDVFATDQFDAFLD